MSRLAVVLLVLLVSIPAGAREGLEQAVWVAFRCTPDRKCYRGTAFHIGNGVFYTNAHVAKEHQGFGALTVARGVSLRERLGTATVLCLNSRALTGNVASPYDIAKIRVATSSAPALPTLTTAVRGLMPGMKLTVIGYPGRSVAPVVATAVIEEIEAFDTFTFRLTSGRAGFGSSGSPVLNERKEVIGILYGQDAAGQLFFATTLRFADRVCTPR